MRCTHLVNSCVPQLAGSATLAFQIQTPTHDEKFNQVRSRSINSTPLVVKRLSLLGFTKLSQPLMFQYLDPIDLMILQGQRYQA